MPGEADLLARVSETGLLAVGEPVLVLISGGRDSVCLLDLAVKIAGAAAVSALHVNYRLRGLQADADERLCRELCDRFGVELQVERPQRPRGSGNLHAWARDLRYTVGARLATARAAQLAVGHTTTDQIETILYRLASSPGRRALLGMPTRSGRLVRPLLAAGIDREQTAAWCRVRGLKWHEDHSNDDRQYARARVRNDLMGAFVAVDRRAAANILRTAELLRAEAEVLDLTVAEVLGNRPDRIELARLAALPPALARLVVRRLAAAACGGGGSGARAAARLDDLLALSDGALDVGDGVRAVVARGMLSFGRTPPRPAA